MLSRYSSNVDIVAQVIIRRNVFIWDVQPLIAFLSSLLKLWDTWDYYAQFLQKKTSETYYSKACSSFPVFSSLSSRYNWYIKVEVCNVCTTNIIKLVGQTDCLIPNSQSMLACWAARDDVKMSTYESLMYNCLCISNHKRYLTGNDPQTHVIGWLRSCHTGLLK